LRGHSTRRPKILAAFEHPIPKGMLVEEGEGGGRRRRGRRRRGRRRRGWSCCQLHSTDEI